MHNQAVNRTLALVLVVVPTDGENIKGFVVESVDESVFL